MTDDRGIVRAYSQDRHIYRHYSIALKQKPPIQFDRTSANYYSNRNCPELVSLFALQNRHLENREKQIYHSISNDEQYFTMINYPIQSTSVTPIPNLVIQNVNREDKEIKFPKVTPRVTSSSVKKFPTLTARSTLTVKNKDSMSTTGTSMISHSLLNKSSEIKMPSVSNEKKNKTQLLHSSRRLE